MSASNAGDPGLIPGSGRSPREGNGNPLQYSCLEKLMDGGAWWVTVHGVTKSWTRLSNFTHSLTQNVHSGFYIISYGKTWTNFLANPVLGAISNPKRWCCESAALNILANLENSAVATGLEKVSFQSQRKAMPKNAQTTTQLHLSHMPASNNVQHSPSKASTVLKLRTSICARWI